MFQLGNGLPEKIAINREIIPAAKPFIMTIEIGSLDEMFLVKLLSNPHKKQADIIPNAPMEIPHTILKLTVRSMLANVIKPIAHQAFLPTDSLKASVAIIVVATPSKLSRSEAVAAGVPRNEKRRIMGAATPPASVAPSSHFASAFCIFASLLLAVFGWISLTKNKPNPHPK